MNGPRLVRTGEDLSVLPGGAVIRTSDGAVYQRDPEHLHWQGIADTDPLTSQQVADEVLDGAPATILWGGPDATETAPPAPVPVTGQVVTTAAELATLPQGSVVVDDRGTARTKRYANSHMGYGWTFAGNSPLTDTELADGHPMLVLHVGHHVPDVLAALKPTATLEGDTP